MSIYKTAIQKPVTTALIFVAILVIGLFSFSRLPIDQFPEMDAPFITVMTTYPGANASEIETNVTKLIENTLSSVEGLKDMTSSSRDNMSVVSLELEWGSDIDEATNDIRSYIDMIKDRLPDNCSSPIIFKMNTSMLPVIQYALTAEESYPGLEKTLNDEVIPRLNRINGIGSVSLSGAPDRYVYVDIDQEKIDAYGIPLETVGSAISANNLNLSSGSVKMENEQYQLQVRSEYEQSKDIEDIIIANLPTGPIYIRDIATVRDTIKDVTYDEKFNGREAVRLAVSKKSGANTVQVCSDVIVEMEKIKKSLPSDVTVDMLYDSSEDIKDSINSLEESILYALLFVVIVVFFFLGKWRATIIISLTIPIALICAFIYLLFVDSSLNIISLCSLTVAIGMVVDDAIVVLENISRHIERGSSPRDAAIYATNEVWTSVIATTLVIVAVFVPLTMLNGMAGILFKELGWIVTIVVCVSTLCAISLTPMLSSQLLKSKKMRINDKGQLEEIAVKNDWYQKYVVGFLNKVDVAYGKLLHWCLKHKGATITIAVLFFIASLIPAFAGKIGTDFMAESDDARISVTVDLEVGTRLEKTLVTARTLETRFREVAPEIKNISTSAGSNDATGLSSLMSSATNNRITMTITCVKKNERTRTLNEIKEVLREEMSTYPEIVEFNCTSGGLSMGSNNVSVEVYGFDFDETNIVAQELQSAITQNVKGARDVKISREKDRSELKITVDKTKAAMYGLTSATISTYVRDRVNGMNVGYLKEDGDEYDILVRLKEENRNSLLKIENLTIPTSTGAMIKLAEVADVEEYWTPPTIDRKNRQRYLSISVTPYKTSLGEMAVAIQREIDKISMPTGVTVIVGGAYEDQQKTFGDLGLLLLLIIILVYIVMASQFESLKKPAIIMMSVPFAISGVVLALFVTGRSLDMIGALGFVMLVGIVVKNGIVLVDYTNLMRDRGYALNDAIAMSGASRIRPVLMTAFTTLLGMLPMALSQGQGAEMWQPMGIVVIGGLLVSTLVTLIIVPVMYGLMSKGGERDKEAKARKEYLFMQIKNN